MPYTAKQKALFNAKAKGDAKFGKLAKEANAKPTKPPVKKAAPKKKK